jgi:rhodanese-related sulfurtransferase
MRWRDWLPFGRVPELTPDELARRLQNGRSVRLIDVRTALEFHHGHIRGAVHVPVHALSAALPALALDPHVPVVAVCKTAHRSIPAVRLLTRQGFAAMQLAGGMDRWRRLGLPEVEGPADA